MVIPPVTATRHTLNGSGVSSNSSRLFTSAVYDESTKQMGAVITLPGGTKFRRATGLKKFHSKLNLGEPQINRGKVTTGSNKGKPIEYTSSGGGYNGDDFLVYNQFADLVNGYAVTSAKAYPIMNPSMRNEAVTKAMLDIGNAKAAIGETLATFRQTIRMISNPSRALYESIMKVKRDKSLNRFIRDSARSLARKGPITRAAERYLEYVYGWKPLMQDIYGAIEFAKEQGQNPLLVHGYGSSRRGGSLPGFSFSAAASNADTRFTEGTENAVCRCSLWAMIDPEYQGLRALNQLGLLNPASLAWELVPMSFVIDWFCPIGPVLQALGARAGLTFVDGSVSIRASAKANIEHERPQGGTGVAWTTNNPATSIWTYEGYSREHLTQWPLPGFWLDTDPLGLERDSDRALKALALAIVRLKS